MALNKISLELSPSEANREVERAVVSRRLVSRQKTPRNEAFFASVPRNEAFLPHVSGVMESDGISVTFDNVR